MFKIYHTKCQHKRYYDINEEIKISKYADDTSLIFNGSPDRFFKIILWNKNNSSKTKVV